MAGITTRFDGTITPLLDYLKFIDGAQSEPNKERLLLGHGREFVSAPLEPAELAAVEGAARRLGMAIDQFPIKQCFDNTQGLVSVSRDLTYVEGYCHRSIPLPHAWLTLNGKVIDPTLRDRGTGKPILGEFSDRVYFGVPMQTKLVVDRMLLLEKTGTLLDGAVDLETEDGLVVGVMYDQSFDSLLE